MDLLSLERLIKSIIIWAILGEETEAARLNSSSGTIPAAKQQW